MQGGTGCLLVGQTHKIAAAAQICAPGASVSQRKYVYLHYTLIITASAIRATGGKPTRQLLRITLKEAEEAATACPSIIRCHRAFLVNLDKVVKVDGNQQGYRLHLEGCKNAIPVSRTYAKKLKERLKGSRHSD